MSIQKDILINHAIGETRMALLEDGIVSDIRLYRDHTPSYVGAIYLGRVIKLSSELQAAFIELEGGMDGFLPLKNLPRPAGKKPKNLTSLLHEGQRLIVQVTAEPGSDKSLKLTARPELISTAIVVHPMRVGAFVSSRIKDPDRRAALKEFGTDLTSDDMGLTFRTSAENIDDDQLKSTAEKMINHWKHITKNIDHGKCPSLLTQGPNATEQIMRHFSAADISNIIIDQASALKEAKHWAHSFAPDMLDKITAYTDRTPIFTHYEVEDQIAQIADDKIMLDSGAWITIERTEALTVIDVNMGRARRSSDRDKQFFAVNREAAREIFRQLRLRAIGGIIVIDFIDMLNKGDIKSLLHFVDELMLSDPEPVQRGNISSFGLLELTRRSRQRDLNGLILTHQRPMRNTTSQCLDLLRDAESEAISAPGQAVSLKVDTNQKKWFEKESHLFDQFKNRTGSTLKMELK